MTQATAEVQPAWPFGEDGIVWLEDPERFDYVRESRTYCGTRHRRPPKHALDAGRMVGYSTLAPNTRALAGAPGCFERRVFWVKHYDRSEDPDGVYRTGVPAEGVDPRTVRPNELGDLTERAVGEENG